MNKTYTQSSLRDYINCPYKYKLKHVEGIYWFQEQAQNSLNIGSDFHLIAERHFSKVSNRYVEDEQLKIWLSELEENFPLEDGLVYLPEYDVRYNEIGLNLMARYDLIVLREDSIDIIDWKTNKQSIKVKDKEEDIQSIVYLFLLANSLALFKGRSYSFNQIRMVYWQPNYPSNFVTIDYSFEKNLRFKEKLIELTRGIEESKFEKNEKHCRICEFDIFCNKKEA